MAETTFTVKIAVQEDGSISLIDQAGAKIASLGQAAQGAKAGLGSLESGTRAIGSAAEDAGGQVAGLGQAAGTIGSAANAAGSAAEAASGRLGALGQAAGAVGSAAQAAGSQMGEAGTKAGELASKAASSTGGLSSMATALISIDAAVRLANAAFDLGKSAIDAFFSGVDRADNLNDLSQKIGVSVSTLSAFELAANTAGTSIEGVGNGFKALSKNLAEAASGNSNMAESFKDVLGASFDVNAGLADTNDTMLKLADAFSGMEDGGKKTSLAMSVLGKSGADLIPFLNQGSVEIKRLTDLSAKLGAVISKDTASAADAFNDNLAILGTAVTGVGTQIAASMLPALKDLTDTIVDFVANDSTIAAFSATFSGAMKSMSAGIQKIADDLNKLGDSATLSDRLSVIFADVTPAIISIGGQLASALWSGFVSVAVSIWNSLDWVDIISAGIFIAIGGPAGAGLAFIGHAILDGITGGAVEKAPEAATQIVDKLAEDLASQAGTKTQVISDDVFVAMLGGAAALAANVLTPYTQPLIDAIPAAIAAGIAAAGAPVVIGTALAAAVVGGITYAFGTDTQAAWNSQLASLVVDGGDTVRATVEQNRDAFEVKLKAAIEFDRTDVSGEAARLQGEIDKANAAIAQNSYISTVAKEHSISYGEALKLVKTEAMQAGPACESLSAAVEGVGAMSSMSAEQQKRFNDALAQSEATAAGYITKLNEITAATQATSEYYARMAAVPVNSDRYLSVEREKAIYDQLVQTLGTVEAAKASVAAQDATYMAAAAAVDAQRVSSANQSVVATNQATQAEYDHIAAMKIASEQYGATGTAQSQIAAIIEQTTSKIIALGDGHEKEAEALRASAESRISSIAAGQAFSADLTKQADAQKTAEEATKKNDAALEQHVTTLGKLDAVGTMWDYAATGVLSYAEAERAAIAVGSASNDIGDRAAAIYARLAEVMQDQTNNTLKAAAATVEKNGTIKAEIDALDAAIASGKSYADAQIEAQKAVILREAEQSKAKDTTTAEAQALNASIDKLAQAKIANIELGAAQADRVKIAQNTDTIRLLELELNLTRQVADGIITKSDAERQMAVAAAGSNEVLKDQAGRMFDIKKATEETKDSMVEIGPILEGAFTQTFDAIVAGTRDLGDSLEGIALSIGKQFFSAMLKDKLKFDGTVEANFLNLGEFGTGVFGKMFSGAVSLGKSLFGGGGGEAGSGGGGFLSGLWDSLSGIGSWVKGLFTGGGSGSGGSGGGFMSWVSTGLSSLGSSVWKGLTGLGGSIGSFFGLGGGAAAGAEVVGMTSAAGATEAIATGATAAASGLSAVAAAVATVLPVIAALGIAIMMLLPAIENWLDTTTKGTKVRMEGEGILNSSKTFGEDSKIRDLLGPITRAYDNLRNMEGGYQTNGPVYQIGRQRATERFVAGGIPDDVAQAQADALAGSGTAIFSKIFSKGKSSSEMVNGAKDMGNMMAEYLSRGLSEGMTYDQMIASMRQFADEAGVTLEVAMKSVAKFGEEASSVWTDGVTGPTEFARAMYGTIEMFKSDFPAGVNVGQAALEAMGANGASAFENLDGATRDWLAEVAKSPEAFQAAMATLNAQGFTIDTEAFMNALADMTASAQAIAPGIAQIFTGGTVSGAIKSMSDKLKTDVMAAFQEVGTKDLFDSTRITQSFQPVYAVLRELKDGAFDVSTPDGMNDFLTRLTSATAEGKANLQEYIPQLKAMKAAADEVQKVMEEAFKPTAAEELAAATEAMAAGLKQSFGNSLGAALNAALADGGSREAGIAAFAESMRGSIKDSVKNSIVQGMVEAAVMQGPLAEMMATFGQAFKGALEGGITAEEQAVLDAYLTRIGAVSEETISALGPSLDTVLKLGEAADNTFGKMGGGTVGVPNDPALAQFKADVEEAQATLKSGFSSAVSEAFSMIGQGKSVEEATAAFSESFKTSISASVSQGLQEALVQSAVMEGALGTMMAQFKEATAAAMADGVITGAEQANLAAMAQQIKTTGEAAANALAPVVASVATIATGVATGTDSVSFAVNTNAETSAAAADTAIANSTTAATTTVTSATTSAAATVSGAVTEAGTAYQAVVTAASEAATEITGGAAAASDTVGVALTGAGESIASGATVAAEQAKELAASGATALAAATTELSASASEVIGSGANTNEAFQQAADTLAAAAAEAAGTSSDTLATAYSEAAAKAAAALDAGGTTISADFAAATSSLSSALSSILGTGDTISDMAPDAAYGIGQSLAAVRDKVAPEMQTQIDALIGSLADASLSPEESERLQQMMASIGGMGSAMTPEQAAQANAVIGAMGDIGSAMTAEQAAQTAAALGSVGDLGQALPPELARAATEALGSLGDIGTALPPELARAATEALGSIGGLGQALPPDLAAQAAAAMNAVGSLGTALTPEMAAQANAVIGAVGSLGADVDVAAMQQAQTALSSIAVIGTAVDPAGIEDFSLLTASLAESAAAIGDPNAVVTTMKALGDAALSSGDAANLAGTMQALGAAALDSGTASDVSATIQAFSAASAEGATNTTAIIDAFSAVDAGTSGQIQSSLQALVSSGVVDGANALTQSLGGAGPDSIVAGLATLQAELDANTLSSMTDPLNDALASVVSPADSVKSALDSVVNPADALRGALDSVVSPADSARSAIASMQNPARDVASRMESLSTAVRATVDAMNTAASSFRSSGTPAAATGGSFVGGSAVVGEAGSPELVTANPRGGFTVTPLTRTEATRLMSGGTPGYAMGGIGVGSAGGFNPPKPALGPPPPPYNPGSSGGDGSDTEFADFTDAIVEAFRAGFEGSKGFVEDFSDAIKESVRTRLIDALMQGFSEGPQIQQYAKNIDELITKAQTLAGNGTLTADELANIQTQIKQNTDAIGAQADAIDELLEPMRQAEAISTAISGGLDFSGALNNLALNPDDLEGFRTSIDQTVNDAVLSGAIQGLLASGPIQDAVKKFGDAMNEAMAGALEDGVISAEESDALHDLAVSGSEEMKTAMEALGPVLEALGIDLGDSLSDALERANEQAKQILLTASSAIDPFATLEAGQTQFGMFVQSIRDQIYGNIRDGIIDAFIDSAVMGGLLAGPMAAIQAVFEQIGKHQLSIAEANAALMTQVGIINDSLNDPTFRDAFDAVMRSIRDIGSELGQSTIAVQAAVDTSTRVAEATQNVCDGKCALERDTMDLGFAAINTFGRQASVSIERMIPGISNIPRMATGGLVTSPTVAMIGEAGPEVVVPLSNTSANIQRLADIAAAVSSPGAVGAPVVIDVDRLAAGTDTTNDALSRLHDRIEELASAILAQPTEVSVQMDRETLMRAMARADRLKRKARYGATA